MSIDPNRKHKGRQVSWWKRDKQVATGNGTRPAKAKNRTFKADSKTSASTKSAKSKTNKNKRKQNAPTSSFRLTEPNLLTCDPSEMTPRQIKSLQKDLTRAINTQQQLEMELNLRSSQVEQMEDNLRLVADQSKMIGVRAMEQEQKLIEMKKALDLKKRQLAIFRRSKADKLELNQFTVLPMHLRGKFSEFLRNVMFSQKKFFEEALKVFVSEGITDQELNYKSMNLTRNNLLMEIGRIGNSLAFDYMTELELRLNGTFDEKQKNEYTLEDDKNKKDNNNTKKEVQPTAYSNDYGTMKSLKTIHTLQTQSRSTTPNPPNNDQTITIARMTPQNSGASTIGSETSNMDTKKHKKPGAFQRMISRKKLKKTQKEFKEKSPQPPAQSQGNSPYNLNQAVPPPQQGFFPSAAAGPHPNGGTAQNPYSQQYAQNPYGQNRPISPNNYFHQYPPSAASQAKQKAQQAYTFHKSRTSEYQKSSSQIAAGVDFGNLMGVGGTSVDLSRSGTMRVNDEDDSDNENGSSLNTSDEDNDTDLNNGTKRNGFGSAPEKSPAYTHDHNIVNIEEDSENKDDSDSEEYDDDDVALDPEALAMQEHFKQLTQTHIQSTIDKHGPNGGSNELTKMWTQFVAFKKGMDKPSTAPLPFRVPDKTNPFVELRDMLEAFPYDLALSILREQEMNPDDRIKDVLLQRGCWPQIRFARNNRSVSLSKSVPFNMILMKIEAYLTAERNEETHGLSAGLSPEMTAMMNGGSGGRRTKPPGNMLLGSLDPQKTTGFRLHQITAIVRARNEAKHSVTALNIRVGRLWNMQENTSDLVNDSIDFFQSLEKPSSMLLLGANTAEKAALCREICKELSDNKMRTALVDTRSTVGGFTQSPLESGQAVRFFVNSIGSQSHAIDSTRSICPQCVVVDECMSVEDIESIAKLQSEGISVIVGTNMHSLEALLGHSVFSQLLPPQDRPSFESPHSSKKNGHSHNGHNGKSHRPTASFSSMSPHLLVLEMNFDGTEVKMYKNIPSAVKAIQRRLEPDYKLYRLNWQGYNPDDSSNATKYMSSKAHARHTSKMAHTMMKNTFSNTNVFAMPSNMAHMLPMIGTTPIHDNTPSS